jgi:hypothetical protein
MRSGTHGNAMKDELVSCRYKYHNIVLDGELELRELLPLVLQRRRP